MNIVYSYKHKGKENRSIVSVRSPRELPNAAEKTRYEIKQNREKKSSLRKSHSSPLPFLTY